MQIEKFGVSQKAFIFNKQGKILVIRRTKTAPIFPLYWDLPGGVLEHGEKMKEAIKREIIEETGLRVKDLELIEAGSLFASKETFWIHILYRAETLSNKVKLSFEHDKFEWISPKKFLKIKSHIAIKNVLLSRGLKKANQLLN
jgi:8-oxo-dGTP pyrophosphatase MutT (NUDIX family)